MANMLRISEAASLAMHTMVLMARDPEQVMSTHGIAMALDVSEAHLSKVLQRLHKAGLVESIRGPKGGFLPAKAPEETTLLEVYECIEGPLAGTTCLLGNRVCDGSNCIMGDLLCSVNERAREYLSGTTIAELARKIRVNA